MPSLLRIVGFLVAALLVLVALRRLQGRGTGSRVPAVALLFVGLGLAAVSVAPDLVRPIQNILGLEGEPLGRLVTLLVITVAIAYAGLFYALARADRANQKVSRLVRALSAAQLEGSAKAPLGGVLVCVPAYDEAENLPGVLDAIPRTVAGLPTHVLVIDDGSADDTSAVARRLGALVVRHPVNSGQGAALQTGYLVAERLGVDIVVTLDADGQHDPAEIDRLVGPIVRDEADFVVGSRRTGDGGPDSETGSRTREAGISIYTRLMNLLGGTQV
ncbi:MAG TPA: glycosyltransferase family 2 protein, partial [Candidatus Limnocylindrales bacterium]